MKTKRNLVQIWLLGEAMLQAVTSGAQPVPKIAAGENYSPFLHKGSASIDRTWLTD